MENKNIRLIVFLVAAALILWLLLLRGCINSGTPDVSQPTTKVYYDTIPVYDTSYITVHVKPKPVKVLPASQDKNHSLIAHYEGQNANGHGGYSAPGRPDEFICIPDTFFYCEDYSVDGNFLFQLHDTTLGEIIGRSYTYADLRPTIVKTIETTLPAPKEKARVYLGGRFTAGGGRALNPNVPNIRVGGGPELLITTPKGFAIQYDYDLWNNTHGAALLFKIKVK